MYSNVYYIRTWVCYLENQKSRGLRRRWTRIHVQHFKTPASAFVQFNLFESNGANKNAPSSLQTRRPRRGDCLRLTPSAFRTRRVSKWPPGPGEAETSKRSPDLGGVGISKRSPDSGAVGTSQWPPDPGAGGTNEWSRDPGVVGTSE